MEVLPACRSECVLFRSHKTAPLSGNSFGNAIPVTPLRRSWRRFDSLTAEP